MPTSSALRSGIKNYARYLNVLSGTEPYVAPPVSAYDLLQTEILTGSQGSVTFSSLGTYSSDYEHFQLRIVPRSSRGDTDSLFYMRFNGDSGSNYSMHNLRGTGSAVDSGWVSQSYPSGIIIYTGLPASSNTAGSFGANVIDILDPFNSSKYTTTKNLNGQVGTFNRIALESGLWLNTNSLTSISFHDVFGSFVTGSRFSLYGLKAA